MASSPSTPNKKESRFPSFEAFYPFYLSQHSKPGTRRLHFLGTTLGLGIVTTNGVLMVKSPRSNTTKALLEALSLALVAGYGFAWISHYFVEQNKPATVQYPWWSFRADFKLWSEMIRGKRWN